MIVCLKFTFDTKKFTTGFGFKEKTVVDEMSLNIYENQITGLLGHNGAGKVLKIKS